MGPDPASPGQQDRAEPDGHRQEYHHGPHEGQESREEAKSQNPQGARCDAGDHEGRDPGREGIEGVGAPDPFQTPVLLLSDPFTHVPGHGEEAQETRQRSGQGEDGDPDQEEGDSDDGHGQSHEAEDEGGNEEEAAGQAHHGRSGRGPPSGGGHDIQRFSGEVQRHGAKGGQDQQGQGILQEAGDGPSHIPERSHHHVGRPPPIPLHAGHDIPADFPLQTSAEVVHLPPVRGGLVMGSNKAYGPPHRSTRPFKLSVGQAEVTGDTATLQEPDPAVRHHHIALDGSTHLQVPVHQDHGAFQLLAGSHDQIFSHANGGPLHVQALQSLRQGPEGTGPPEESPEQGSLGGEGEGHPWRGHGVGGCCGRGQGLFHGSVQDARQLRGLNPQPLRRGPGVEGLGQGTVVQGHHVAQEGAPGQVQGIPAGVGSQRFLVHQDPALGKDDGKRSIIVEMQAERCLPLRHGDLVGDDRPKLALDPQGEKSQKGKGPRQGDPVKREHAHSPHPKGRQGGFCGGSRPRSHRGVRTRARPHPAGGGKPPASP